jgi:hypothetical protein
MGAVIILMSLPKVWSKPATNMAWYGTVCHSRPVDQLKPYFVSRESSYSSHNYNLKPAGFNALAKRCVPENFRSKSYWIGAAGATEQQALSTWWMCEKNVQFTELPSPHVILAVLPNKDREIYGLFTRYASCLFVQSMHVNWSNALV